MMKKNEFENVNIPTEDKKLWTLAQKVKSLLFMVETNREAFEDAPLREQNKSQKQGKWNVLREKLQMFRRKTSLEREQRW